jgi:hypothetical protein
MSLSNPPEVALWLSVPDTCRMRADFEPGDHEAPDIHLGLGGNNDGSHLSFEREALERFAELAQRMLAISDPRTSFNTALESSYPNDIRDISPPTVA